jgi:ribosome-binding protein aMBF1 (putative translation factor)
MHHRKTHYRGQGMKRTTFTELKERRIAAMTPTEKVLFDTTYEATRLAIDVGDKIRDAREAAGISQRDLATRMGTSQAAVARLEAGGVGATLTTLQKVAGALDLKVTVELSAAS